MRHEATGKRKVFCIALCVLLLAFGLSAEAQQPTKVPRIGYLGGVLPSANAARRLKDDAVKAGKSMLNRLSL
jgi:hypothetical protein